MTLRGYHDMIRRIRDSGRPVGGVADFLTNPSKHGVVLRHDVDRRPGKSLKVAELEHHLDIRSTFYFRIDREGAFAEKTVRSIARLGHEIGYHYETLSSCNGNLPEALNLFEANLRRLRMVCDCKTVSMHGQPLSKHDNGSLLKDVTLANFGLIGDATTSMLNHGPSYFTDVGGQWNHPHANLRDYVGEFRRLSGNLQNPAVLAEILSAPTPVYISTHPERWSDGVLDAIYCWVFDVVANTTKRVLRRSRTRRSNRSLPGVRHGQTKLKR